MTSTVSKALRNIVAERDSYTCVLCSNAYTDMHHIKPRSKGGRNTPYNLVSVCRKCHMTLHHEIIPSKRDWCNGKACDHYDGGCIGITQCWHDEMEYRITEYISDYYADDEEFWKQF